MLPLSLDELRVLPRIGGHLDDIEIGCAGTIRQLLSARPDLEVHWIVLSGRGDRSAEAEAEPSTRMTDRVPRPRLPS